jgi:hypothetical protein
MYNRAPETKGFGRNIKKKKREQADIKEECCDCE